MTLRSIIEVAVAVLLILGGLIGYRRGGNQGAVLSFIIAAILLIHGLGLMRYHPSQTEMEQQ
jgi:uncharacterized membrane protein (UPF0136 family)